MLQISLLFRISILVLHISPYLILSVSPTSSLSLSLPLPPFLSHSLHSLFFTLSLIPSPTFLPSLSFPISSSPSLSVPLLPSPSFPLSLSLSPSTSLSLPLPPFRSPSLPLSPLLFFQHTFSGYQYHGSFLEWTHCTRVFS